MMFVELPAQVSFTNYSSEDGLADDFVSGGIVIDNSNAKWFGTQSGISKLDGDVWTTYTTTEGLVDNYIQCLAIDDSDNLWIGTSNGVSFYDGTTFTNYTTVEGLPDNSINYLVVDNAGDVWIGTFSGLTKYDGSTFTTYTTADGMSSDLIGYLLPVGDDLWIGTYAGGVMKYDGSTFLNLTTADGLMDNNVSAIAVDADAQIWVGSYYGIAVLGAGNAVVATYTMAGVLFNEYIQDMSVDADGNVVICEFADYLNDGGVTVYDGTNWVTYEVTDGLIDKLVKRVKFDNDGYAWITTGGGVSKMDISSQAAELNYLPSADVYPNPFTDHISISGITGDFNYTIVDATGRIIVQESNVSNTEISLDNLAKGMYMLMYENQEISCSTKIIKQ